MGPGYTRNGKGEFSSEDPPTCLHLVVVELLHLVVVELLNIFLFCRSFFVILHLESKCEGPGWKHPTAHTLCVFLLQIFSLRISAILHFYTEESPPPPLRRSLLPAPTTFCARIQMTWGRFLAEEWRINKILIQGFSLGNILCRIREVHIAIFEKYLERSEKYSETCF